MNYWKRFYFLWINLSYAASFNVNLVKSIETDLENEWIYQCSKATVRKIIRAQSFFQKVKHIEINLDYILYCTFVCEFCQCSPQEYFSKASSKSKFCHNPSSGFPPFCKGFPPFCKGSVLLCPSFEMQRRDFLAGVSELLRSFVQIDTLPNNVLIECLLYGDKNLTDDVNRSILELTLEFIHRTGRFD